jgi:hypothetical protein
MSHEKFKYYGTTVTIKNCSPVMKIRFSLWNTFSHSVHRLLSLHLVYKSVNIKICVLICHIVFRTWLYLFIPRWNTFVSGDLCVDSRPAVRKSAGQTLFSTISAHGGLLHQPTWQAVLWQASVSQLHGHILRMYKTLHHNASTHVYH